MRQVVFLLCILLFGTLSAAAFADDSDMHGEGGSPGLMTKNPTISMVREDVHFNPLTQKVDARFVFHNDGPATTVLMGFPEHASGEGAGIGPYPKTPRNGFVSLVDGKSVKVAPIVRPGEWMGGSGTVWWTKRVAFGAGQTRIVIDRYTGGGGRVNGGNKWFSYILISGATWKGPIGRAVVTCDMSGLPYSPIDISPAGYKHEGNNIVWDWTNLDPKSDISLYWYPAYLNVAVNGKSIAEERFNVDNFDVAKGDPTSLYLTWDDARWTPVTSRRRGSDVWLPVKTASAWLGGTFRSSRNGQVAKVTLGKRWIAATVGSSVLRTDHGPVSMPYRCRDENTNPALLFPFSGSAPMVSLRSVAEALGGSYAYDAKTDKVIISEHSR